ncbi:MAG TPA: AtpZ/AtpI family protein [Thermoanaerobaculia bacterium]|nr:AtpZ/AtpI family protein [Thermoanaerobaculia bacterium]
MASPENEDRGWIRLGGLGIELVASVAGFVAVGFLLDRHYGWSPWGVLIGAALGFIGGLYNLIRGALLASREAAGDTAAKDRERRER